MTSFFLDMTSISLRNIFSERKILNRWETFPAFECLTLVIRMYLPVVFKYSLHFEKKSMHFINFLLDMVCHSKISRVNQNLWLKKWPHRGLRLSRYPLQNIFNVDEFGLFYQCLANKTLHSKGEKCSGGKHSKIRLTGLVAGKVYGEKLPMFVIWKC